MGILTNLTGGGLGAQIAKQVKKARSKKIEDGSKHSYAKGGKVRKTGLARLHKGEMVLTKAQAKSHRKCAGK